MRIVLVYPYFIDPRIDPTDIASVPMGVYSIAAVLRENGYSVDILNCSKQNLNLKSFEEVVQQVRPNVVGFSILNSNRWGAIDIARLVKSVDTEIRTVFGGVGASFLWHHLLSHFKDIDYVVIGEGEYSFLQLIQHLEKKNNRPPIEIPGIAYRHGTRVVQNDPAPFIQDLDALPHPARFFSFQHVSLSRGCPENCSFCGSPAIWQRRVRFHSPEYFVAQLEMLRKKGIYFFYFSDDTFTLQKDRAIAVCRQIIEKSLAITWQAISNVKYVDADILYWMRKAGCIQISYGVESGAAAIRKTFNKNITNDQIEKAFHLTTRYGLMPRAYFIYGSPGEDAHSIQASLELMERIRPLSAVFYILDLFPGTALYEDWKASQHLTDAIWLERIEDILYYETDRVLTRDAVLNFGRTLRRFFYEHLPDFIDKIDLVDAPDLFPAHADFLSRLGMTFIQGDYAKIDAIPHKVSLAEKLFRRALSYAPDHRSFLGLGMLYQQQRAFTDSIRVLEKGLSFFPESDPMKICTGINYMNTERFDKALSCFEKIQDAEPVADYIRECYRRLESKKTLS